MPGKAPAHEGTNLPTPFSQTKAEATRSEFRQEGAKAPQGDSSRLGNGTGDMEPPLEPELTFFGQIAAPRSGKTVAPPASTSLIWEYKAWSLTQSN